MTLNFDPRGIEIMLDENGGDLFSKITLDMIPVNWLCQKSADDQGDKKQDEAYKNFHTMSGGIRTPLQKQTCPY